MQPFPAEPTPDDLSGIDRPAAVPAPPVFRVPGRIQLRRLTRPQTVALGAAAAVVVGSFLPWYRAHVGSQPSLIDPCPADLHGTDRQICEDENRYGGVVSVAHFAWSAWNTPRAWVAVLFVIVFAAVVVRQVMPAYRPLPGLVLVGLVAAADLLVLQAIVFLPSPGPSLNGIEVPGGQAWRVTWGLYIVLAGMLTMTIAIAIDYISTQRKPAPVPVESGPGLNAAAADVAESR